MRLAIKIRIWFRNFGMSIIGSYRFLIDDHMFVGLLHLLRVTKLTLMQHCFKAQTKLG